MLILAQDGIFPIVYDRNGERLVQIPASGFSFPGTIQGEGKLNGIPSLFIRLAGCNLQCRWTNREGVSVPCDTAYASYEVKNTSSMSLDDMVSLIRYNTQHLSHLVITGGEPFLQSEELIQLCIKLKQIKNYHITVETNATLFREELAEQVDFFSLSPKLSSANASTKGILNPINLSVIQSFITHSRLKGKDFQLKFVYAAEKDAAEIRDLLSHLTGWKREDILLMLLGTTSEELRQTTRQALSLCIQEGWRYCDRLHISLFGNQKGV